MSISGIQLARVSNLLSSRAATGQIQRAQKQLLETQNQISTGQRLNTPSDDPGDSAVVMQLQRAQNLQAGYLKNIQQAQSNLSEADSTLGDLTDLLTQAQTIASQNAGSTVSAGERAASGALVQGLYTQAMSIANKKFGNSYLFGGDKSTSPPFVNVAGGVQFVGSAVVLQNNADANTLIPYQVSGAQLFGGLSSQVTGSVNLSPSLTLSTRIVDLHGATGSGVQLGTVQIGNGTITKPVDLAQSDSLADVVSKINAAGVGGVTAAISGNHLVLSGAGSDNITVTDVGGGTSAASLGILKTTGAGAGVSAVGSGVQPAVTALTTLLALNNGAGIDTTHGLILTNGTASVTVNLSAANTVEDAINAINSAGANVRAQINAAGTGIDILNPVQGTQMTIGENGGATAADLGVRSFSPATALADLNNGKGVAAAGAGPDFQITRSDGTSFPVSITGARTVQDVINQINSAAGGAGLTASFATTGNGIVLTDTAGGAGTPTVTSLNASTAAADLGLTTAASGNTIGGSDVNGVQTPGILANLAKLRDALSHNDQAGITAAAQLVSTDHDRVVAMRGQTGAAVQELENRQTSMQTQGTSTQALISQLQDTNMAAAISTFSTLQTSLQASLQVSAASLKLSLLNYLG